MNERVILARVDALHFKRRSRTAASWAGASPAFVSGFTQPRDCCSNCVKHPCRVAIIFDRDASAGLPSAGSAAKISVNTRPQTFANSAASADEQPALPPNRDRQGVTGVANAPPVLIQRRQIIPKMKKAPHGRECHSKRQYPNAES